MSDSERRNYDSEIAGIRKDMRIIASASVKSALIANTIKIRQEEHIKKVDVCRAETLQNSKDIGSVRTVQRITAYLAGGTFFIAIGAFVKHMLKSSQPPGT